MSNILITGAAGFIGSQMAHKFWQDGDSVTLIDDFSYGKEDNLIFDDHDFRKEILVADVCDRDYIQKLFKGNSFDYVYHIAAITPLPDCQMKPARATDVNVGGTVNILENARRYGVKKVIFASTSAVYENCEKFPTAEEDVVPPTLVYSSSKYIGEHMCKSFSDCYHLDVTVIRFANIYGPHIDCLRTQPPVAGYIIRQLLFGDSVQLHSDGNQRRDFVYVDDLLELTKLVRNGTGFDIVNASSNTTHSINEMYDIIADIMDKSDVKPEYHDTKHFWFNYPDLYSGVYPLDPAIMDHEVLKHTECDNVHAKEKYGWEPVTDFKEGLKKTVEYSVDVIRKDCESRGKILNG